LYSRMGVQNCTASDPAENNRFTQIPKSFLLFFIAARVSAFGQENSSKRLSFMKKKTHNLLKKNQIILLVRKTGSSLQKYRAYLEIYLKNGKYLYVQLSDKSIYICKKKS